MKMTQREIDEALTAVLTQYGELVRIAQGSKERPRKTIGSITIQFHDDGQYSFAYAGVFQKATTMGALFDCLLNFREQIYSDEAAEQISGLIESLTLDPKDVN
jgi:hypothetical protein